jgi:hypothetical protein
VASAAGSVVDPFEAQGDSFALRAASAEAVQDLTQGGGMHSSGQLAAICKVWDRHGLSGLPAPGE